MSDMSLERWNGTRLWVYRGADYGAAAILLRRGGLKNQQDTLHKRTQIPMGPNSRASVEPCFALFHALVKMQDVEWAQNALRDVISDIDNPYFKRPGPDTPGGS